MPTNLIRIDFEYKRKMQSENKLPKGQWSLTWVQCAKVKSHFKKFKLIQALMLVLVTWKYQKDPIKNNREKVETPFSPL